MMVPNRPPLIVLGKRLHAEQGQLVDPREMGSIGVVVDACHDNADKFYLRHEFMPLPGQAKKAVPGHGDHPEPLFKIMPSPPRPGAILLLSKTAIQERHFFVIPE